MASFDDLSNSDGGDSLGGLSAMARRSSSMGQMDPASSGMGDPNDAIMTAIQHLDKGTEAHGLDFNTMMQIATPLFQAQHFGMNGLPVPDGGGRVPIKSGDMKGGLGLGGFVGTALGIAKAVA